MGSMLCTWVVEKSNWRKHHGKGFSFDKTPENY
jgi:hypothetical protein